MKVVTKMFNRTCAEIPDEVKAFVGLAIGFAMLYVYYLGLVKSGMI